MTTLKKLTIAMGFASFAIAAPMAMAQAQDPAAGQQYGQPEQQAAAPVSDADLEKFVSAESKVNEIRDDFSQRLGQVDNQEEAQSLQLEAQEKMVEAVQDEGLDVGRYNEIATRIQTDPELQQRAQQHN